MRYLIMGTGALGSVFGGLLRQAGKQVDFLGRGAHFAVLRRQGLRLTGIWGDHECGPVTLPPPGQLYDCILLCVKSFDTATAARDCRQLLAPAGLLISVQNGLGNLEILASLLPPGAVAGARVIFGAQIIQPGTVKVTVYADKVLLGHYPAAPPSPSLQQVAADLNQAGIPTATVTDILPPLWDKVLYNCALNPLGAILAVNYGALAADPETRALMRQVIEEIYAVARAKGVSLTFPTAAAYFQHFLERLVPPTAAHYPSMLQDLQQGRRTEIEALNGAICRYAAALGLPTPYNDSLCRLVRFRERQLQQSR